MRFGLSAGLAGACSSLSLHPARSRPAPAAHAAFITGTVKYTSDHLATNIYSTAISREGDGQNKREEWGQGFLLDVRSGYTRR